MPEVTLTLEEYAQIREFVRKKLSEKGRVNILDIKEVVPPQVKDQSVLLAILADAIGDVGEDVGALFLKYDPDLDEFTVLSRDEYDPKNPYHLLLDEVRWALDEVTGEEGEEEGPGELEDEVWGRP